MLDFPKIDASESNLHRSLTNCPNIGDQDNIGVYMQDLDAAGIPMFLKSVDAYGTIAQAVNLTLQSGVPHIGVAVGCCE